MKRLNRFHNLVNILSYDSSSFSFTLYVLKIFFFPSLMWYFDETYRWQKKWFGKRVRVSYSNKFPNPSFFLFSFFICHVVISIHFRKLIWIFSSGWLDWGSWIWAPSEYECKAEKSHVESFSYVMNQKVQKKFILFLPCRNVISQKPCFQNLQTVHLFATIRMRLRVPMKTSFCLLM